MYFIDEDHEQNFITLTEIYGKKALDLQYRPCIYIAAIPSIYELIDLEKIRLEQNSPLSSLVEYSEHEHILVVSHPGITGSSRRLVEIGLSLFNGNPCDLDFQPSMQHGIAITEALKLRFFR